MSAPQIRSIGPGFLEARGADRIVHFSDVHGYATRFGEYLARAGVWRMGEWLARPGTLLVVNGDLIDRGPQSRQVVERVLELRDDAPAHGVSVVVLRGNHEDLAIRFAGVVPDDAGQRRAIVRKMQRIAAGRFEDGEGEDEVGRFAANGGLSTIESYGGLEEFMEGFSGGLGECFASLPYGLQVGNKFFTHTATANLRAEEFDAPPAERLHELLWNRDFFSAGTVDPEHGEPMSKFLASIGATDWIVGHTPLINIRRHELCGGRGLIAAAANFIGARGGYLAIDRDRAWAEDGFWGRCPLDTVPPLDDV